jgi:hypothetical protein
MDLKDLISNERMAIDLLERKLQERRTRLNVLLSLVESPRDALDRMLDVELGAAKLGSFFHKEATPPVSGKPAPASARTPLSPQAAWPFPTSPPRNDAAEPASSIQRGERALMRRRLDEKSQAILRFLGEETKSLQDITSHLIDRKLITEDQSDQVRSMLFHLRHAHQLVENVARGLYRRTREQLDLVDL